VWVKMPHVLSNGQKRGGTVNEHTYSDMNTRTGFN